MDPFDADTTVHYNDGEPMKHSYGRRCIFINGPVGSGKDTAAYFIKRNFGAIDYKISGPLKAAIRELLNINPDMWRKIMNNATMKETKHFLSSKSYRDLIISLYEDWITPVFGPAFLGEVAANYFRHAVEATPLYTISDAGVEIELEPIVQEFGYDNCGLIVLKRDGCEFGRDYRSRVNGDNLGIAQFTIVNQYDLALFEQQCIKAVKNLWPSLETKT